MRNLMGDFAREVASKTVSAAMNYMEQYQAYAESGQAYNEYRAEVE